MSFLRSFLPESVNNFLYIQRILKKTILLFVSRPICPIFCNFSGSIFFMKCKRLLRLLRNWQNVYRIFLTNRGLIKETKQQVHSRSFTRKSSAACIWISPLMSSTPWDLSMATAAMLRSATVTNLKTFLTTTAITQRQDTLLSAPIQGFLISTYA